MTVPEGGAWAACRIRAMNAHHPGPITFPCDLNRPEFGFEHRGPPVQQRHRILRPARREDSSSVGRAGEVLTVEGTEPPGGFGLVVRPRIFLWAPFQSETFRDNTDGVLEMVLRPLMRTIRISVLSRNGPARPARPRRCHPGRHRPRSPAPHPGAAVPRPPCGPDLRLPL